jgi:hypothetical protein
MSFNKNNKIDINENHFETKEKDNEEVKLKDVNSKILKSIVLSGEAELKSDDEVSEWNLDTNSWIKGTLIITNYRLIFIPSDYELDKNIYLNKQNEIRSLPLASMHKVEKIGGKSTASEFRYNIGIIFSKKEIYLKNGLISKFYFNPKGSKRKAIHKYLKEENRRFFAFDYKYPLKEG